jgi:hypothetical protein
VLPYGAGGFSVKACLWRAPLQTVKPQEEHEARKAMTEGSRTWLSRTDHEQLDWGPNLPSDMDGRRGRGRCPLLRAARGRGLGAREGRANGEPGGLPDQDRCTKLRVDAVGRVVVEDPDSIS